MQNYMCLLGRVCCCFCLNSLSREYKCSFLLGFPLFSGNIGKLHFPVPLEMGENMWPVPAKVWNASIVIATSGLRDLEAVGYSLCDLKESDTTDQLSKCAHVTSTFLRSICGIWGTFCFPVPCRYLQDALLPSSVPHLDCKSSLIPLQSSTWDKLRPI